MKLFVILAAVSLLMSSESPAADMRSQVLAQLRASGSDLSLPHAFEFYFYFPDREAAQAAGESARAAGYTVVVRPAAVGSDWLCLASQRLVPASAPWADIERFTRDLAKRHKGEFDGWEAEVAKR